VLWTLVAVTALGSVAIATARLGGLTTRNRVLLGRAAWAREACAEMVLGSAGRRTLRRLDSVDLGRGTWCDATLEDPSTKLNLNVADRAALAAVLRAVAPAWAVDSLVDGLVAWRRRAGGVAALAALAAVPGFDDSLIARLGALVTTRGTGAINVNAAPPVVLATLPGMTEEALELVLARRGDAPLTGADALAALLTPGARTTLLGSYPEFVRAVAFAPPQLIAIVRGGVRGTSLVARVTLTLAPVAGRLAVLRRETEE